MSPWDAASCPWGAVDSLHVLHDTGIAANMPHPVYQHQCIQNLNIDYIPGGTVGKCETINFYPHFIGFFGIYYLAPSLLLNPTIASSMANSSPG